MEKVSISRPMGVGKGLKGGRVGVLQRKGSRLRCMPSGVQMHSRMLFLAPVRVLQSTRGMHLQALKFSGNTVDERSAEHRKTGFFRCFGLRTLEMLHSANTVS